MVIFPCVRKILAPNPSFMTGRGTNTYLVGTSNLIVVDPGPDLDEHVEAIMSEAAEVGGRITAILVTHDHPDHVGALAGLRSRTAARVFGPAGFAGADQILADGEGIHVGEVSLRAIETPGHADSHLCFWIEADRYLFCGDLIAGYGTLVLSQTTGSLTRYLDSLHRVAALGSLTILPGHGPVILDGPGKIQEYLDHRAMRERQIVEALSRGPATVDGLVRRLYAETPPQLFAMAAHNVRAHLEHLENLGRAVRQGDEWELTSESSR
jgi:glyoxylase-like metal-dependent hydrolase (beta-lactamase superfamily II)